MKEPTLTPNGRWPSWYSFGNSIFSDVVRLPVSERFYACDCLTGGSGKFQRRHTEVCPDCRYYCPMVTEFQLSSGRVSRKPTSTDEEILRLRSFNYSYNAISKELGLSRKTVYRVITGKK